MASQFLILDFINPDHPIKVLADQIPWQELESKLAQYYAPKAPDHKPLRLMGGLLLLKNFYALDNEDLLESWTTNPYFQYFTGITTFQWEPPFELKDLEQLTASIGEELPQELLTISLALLASQTIEDEITNKLLNNLDDQLTREWEEEFSKELEEESELEEDLEANKFEFEEEYKDDFDEFEEDEFEGNFDEDYEEDDF